MRVSTITSIALIALGILVILLDYYEVSGEGYVAYFIGVPLLLIGLIILVLGLANSRK